MEILLKVTLALCILSFLILIETDGGVTTNTTSASKSSRKPPSASARPKLKNSSKFAKYKVSEFLIEIVELKQFP